MPVEMVAPKGGTGSELLPWGGGRPRPSTPGTAQRSRSHETRRATGDSFALGLRLAGVLARAGSLGAAISQAPLELLPPGS